MRVAAVVLCAGSSSRFGEDKMWLPLGGESVWERSVRAFTTHSDIDEVIVVTRADQIPHFKAKTSPLVPVVAGGASRLQSSLNGLNAVSKNTEVVLFHDGARPFVSHATISAVLDAAIEHGAASPVLPSRDTVRMIVQGETYDLDRESLRLYQTPQAGRVADFRAAFDAARGDETDDVALLQNIGVTPALVPGSEQNWKITTREDIARIPMEIRTGLGYDIHSFSNDPERPMWLGGVEFDDRPGLEGHSDADALIHAIADSLLGAANLGDIGVHFANTDEQWRNCPSSRFLETIAVMLHEHRWEIVNIDSTVVAERPKVMARRDEICHTVAAALGISADRMSVKATTNEKLGAIGRAEGIAAFAISTVRRMGPTH